MQRVICCLKEIPAGGKQSVRGELETELEHFALRLLKEGVSLDLYGTKEKEVDAFIIEFKVVHAKNGETLETAVQAALKQIEEKKYDLLLRNRGISAERIRKYGFAFEGKKVLIG